MKHGMLLATAVAFLALGAGALGAAGSGSEILDPAFGAIEDNMPAEAQDTSGVMDVLEGVAERLDELLPDEVGVPEDLPADAEIPTELPPEEADIPIELPAEADEGLDTAESALETIPF